jgi:hypothetical protein
MRKTVPLRPNIDAATYAPRHPVDGAVPEHPP